MLPSTSENLTSSQRSTGVQLESQGGGNKVSIITFVDKFIEHGKKFELMRKGGQEKKFAANIKIVVQQVAEERRRERVFNFLHSTVDKDQAVKLTEFYNSWCQLTTVLDEEEYETCRLAGLRLVLSVLNTRSILPLYLSILYDLFVKQVQLCDNEQVLSLLEIHSGSLLVSNLSSRWSDISLVLSKQLLKNEEIRKDDNILKTMAYIRDLVYKWMNQASTFEAFGAVLTVIRNLSMVDLIEKFFDEHSLNGLSDVEQRPSLTSKYINLLLVVDSKRLLRILREMVSAWPKKLGITSARDLMSCVAEMVKLARCHPNIGKACVGFYKSDLGMVLSSEFGFLLMFAFCNIDRYKTLMMTELTKAFQKLWNFKESVHEFGWIENSGVGNVVAIVEDQITCLVQRLEEDVEAFELLFEPTVLLLQSLLKLPSTRDITIVDGRVADGCPIWLFASKVLVKLIITRRKELSLHLATIVELATTSSTSISFIYVDMLVEIVRTCTLYVLNNWRELLFLFKYICCIRRDVSVSLVRCFMPIINHRPQLREQLLLSIKVNILDSRNANAVVPLLMLIFRSFSKLPKVVACSQLSQSFATFSSQSLQAIGCKRKTDETVCLEVVGLLKRCLSQWTPTKTAVYLGFAEEGRRNSAMTGQCLDFLVSHAATVPEWKAETMCITSGGVVSLLEPLPQLVQAIQCLLCDEITADVTSTQTQVGANVQKSASDLIDSWVLKACSEDVHDLGVDKLSEWNPTTSVGCANLLFARMMLNLYDALIEYEWNKFHESRSATYVDRMTALLGRRKELDEVLQEKYLRRKESKVGTIDGGPSVDLKQPDILVNCSTITQIFENIIPPELFAVELNEIQCELLDWAIDRVHFLTESLLDAFHPLHSIFCATGDLISAASFLLDYYASTNCVDWIEARNITFPSKTKALEAYANIVQYLSTKYRSQPIKVLSIWKRSDLNISSSRGGEKTLTTNGSLVRHCHMFITKLFPAILSVDHKEGEERKSAGVLLERQAKAMFKICSALIKLMDSQKCYITMFKFTIGILEKNVVTNNLILRELLKWLCNLALKCMDTDNEVEKAINTIADDLVQVLSEEVDECKYKFVERASKRTICDFLASLIDRSLIGVRAVISFAGTFQAKDQRMDEALTAALTKCSHCCQMTSRLLPLHSQFAVERERLVQTLTALFSAIQEPVDLMLSNVKSVPEMVEWKSLVILSKLLKEKLQTIMAIADEHVGTFNPDEMTNNRKKSIRKDEIIYVKYVRAREALQSQVLLMSEALKEDRLNFQVKKNTIGMRDFRINLNTLRTRVIQGGNDEPKKKKNKKQSQTMTSADEVENIRVNNESDDVENESMVACENDTSGLSVVY